MRKSNLEITYKIDETNFKVQYLKSISASLTKDILNIKNIPNILVVYDKNIDKRIINDINQSLKKIKNKIYILEVFGGKQHKDSQLLFKIINILSKNNFTKNSIILSVGGGVVGDVSSFAAAIYMRGIYYFHIPTTMTSILDSCIGGKTAINYHNKINLLGTYYHPHRVYILHNIIITMPQREFFSGFAEAIKCGIINDKIILNILGTKENQIKNRDYSTLKELCLRVLRTKIKFFKNDVREKNKRLILNFGHTFAHAIEMASSLNNKKYQINHGEAVAIGLICEMRYAKTSSIYIEYIKNILKKYEFGERPKIISGNKLNFKKKIYKNLFLDKKRLSKFPRYIKIKKQSHSIVAEITNFKKAKEIIDKLI